jgi:hypothetical protein
MSTYKKPSEKATETVTFRLTRDERALLGHLAELENATLTDLVRTLVTQRAKELNITEIPEPPPKRRPGRPRYKQVPPPTSPIVPPQSVAPPPITASWIPEPSHTLITIGDLVTRYRDHFSDRAEGTRRELDDTLRLLTGSGDYPPLVESQMQLTELNSNHVSTIRENIRAMKIRFARKNLHLNYLRMMLHFAIKTEDIKIRVNPAEDLRPLTITESPDGWPRFSG